MHSLKSDFFFFFEYGVHVPKAERKIFGEQFFEATPPDDKYKRTAVSEGKVGEWVVITQRGHLPRLGVFLSERFGMMPKEVSG